MRRSLVAIATVLLFTLPAAGNEPERFGHVERVGNGSDTLILVPCLGCDWRSFDRFMQRNAERYTMYAVTWPGLGGSALPRVEDSSATPYWDYVVRAMVRLIREEGLRRPTILGHSAAGSYVVQLAHDHPELIGKAISVDATISNAETLGFSREQRLAWAEREMAETLERLDDDQAWREFHTRAASSLEERAELYAEMWLTPPRRHVFAYWRDWLAVDAGSMLPKLRVPLLTVYATGDDPAEFVRRKEERLAANGVPPELEIAYVQDSGHTIWEYQPDRFDAIVSDFVLRPRRPPPAFARNPQTEFDGGLGYDPSAEFPYGRPNPEAPAELQQFAFFIGDFDCTDRILQQDGSWTEFPAVRGARYFLNGFAIQDHYWSPTFYTSNLRLYDASEGMWKVTYVSMPRYASGTWTGGLAGSDMVLEQPGKSADGKERISRLTFFERSDDAFEWKSENVVDGVAQVTWTSSCRRR